MTSSNHSRLLAHVARAPIRRRPGWYRVSRWTWITRATWFRHGGPTSSMGEHDGPSRRCRRRLVTSPTGNVRSEFRAGVERGGREEEERREDSRAARSARRVCGVGYSGCDRCSRCAGRELPSYARTQLRMYYNGLRTLLDTRARARTIARAVGTCPMCTRISLAVEERDDSRRLLLRSTSSSSRRLLLQSTSSSSRRNTGGIYLWSTLTAFDPPERLAVSRDWRGTGSPTTCAHKQYGGDTRLPISAS